jgi:hypothetical protein
MMQGDTLMARILCRATYVQGNEQMKKPVIKGSRGKWTAEYEGQPLPVIHNLRVTRTKGADAGQSRLEI